MKRSSRASSATRSATSPKHTLAALQKSNSVQAAAAIAGQDRAAIAQAAYSTIIENQWDQKDELEADRVGVTVANKVGYAPSGLSSFLTRLAEGRKGAKELTGMFAILQTEERITALKTLTVPPTFTAKATVAEQFRSSVKISSSRPASVSRWKAGNGDRRERCTGTGEEVQVERGHRCARQDEIDLTGKGDSPAEKRWPDGGVNPNRDAKGGPD